MSKRDPYESSLRTPPEAAPTNVDRMILCFDINQIQS